MYNIITWFIDKILKLRKKPQEEKDLLKLTIFSIKLLEHVDKNLYKELKESVFEEYKKSRVGKYVKRVFERTEVPDDFVNSDAMNEIITEWEKRIKDKLEKGHPPNKAKEWVFAVYGYFGKLEEFEKRYKDVLLRDILEK